MRRPVARQPTRLSFSFSNNIVKKRHPTAIQPVPTGIFGADMKVRLLNDGPVTIVLDSPA